LLTTIAQDRAEIAQDAALIRQSGSTQASLTGQKSRLAQWDASIADASWKLGHASPELMSAQLQHLVQGFATQAGASIASFRALPVQIGKRGDMIGLEFEVETSSASLRNLLFSIETARPRIFIDRLAIQAPETGNTAQAPFTVTLHLTICALPPATGAI
jgi:hypothetical protein